MTTHEKRSILATRGRTRPLPRAIGTGLVLLLLVALAACGGAEGTSDEATATGATADSADPTGPEVPADAVAHYPLETDLDSSVPDAPSLEPVGDVELVDDDGSTVAEFAADGGFALDVGDLISSDSYTLAFRFYLDSEDSGWLKLVDMDDRGTDNGFYVFRRGFQFYNHPLVDGDAPIGGPPYATVALRRDADGQMNWFVDGDRKPDIDDSEKAFGALGSSTMYFFLDDTVPDDSGVEQSSGRVAWLSVFDEALSDGAIAELGS